MMFIHHVLLKGQWMNPGNKNFPEGKGRKRKGGLDEGQTPSEEASFGFSSVYLVPFSIIFPCWVKNPQILKLPLPTILFPPPRDFLHLGRAHKFPTSSHSFLDLVWPEMSFEDIEWGRSRPGQKSLAWATKRREDDDSSQAVAAGVFRINTAVSAFYRLVNSLGTPKDTLELREKL